jgi:hypothetical protein
MMESGVSDLVSLYFDGVQAKRISEPDRVVPRVRTSVASSISGERSSAGAASTLPPGSRCRSRSTACRKLTPSRRITQSMTLPPAIPPAASHNS